MRNWTKVALIVIVFLGLILRVYKLASVPPSLNWDETAAAYNAFTIKNWGRDEWGKIFPLVFTSFRDDKHPIHIYTTALFYTFFGVSDFTTRLPSALVGVLAIIFIYLLVKNLTGSDTAGIFSALFLAFSPYAIHYSRGLWEANFAVSIFIVGLGSLYYGLAKENIFIILAYIFWGLSLISYHAAKVVVPPVVILISFTYFTVTKEVKRIFMIGILIFAGFVSVLFIEPRLLGLARISQTKLPPQLVQNTYLYKKTNSELLGRLEVSVKNYQKYYAYDYLFKRGDQEPRGSVKIIGEFYKINILLAPLGIIFLLYKKKWKFLIILLLWFFLGAIPGALAGSNPNSTRSIFMLGTLEVASGIGVGYLLSLIKKRVLKIILVCLILIGLGYETLHYLTYYFTKYSENEAIQWQYGMKQVATYVKENTDYKKVYVTKIRNQPYIFFLYYLQYPLHNLLKDVKYDETGSKSYNRIESFNKYNFGNWDYRESQPETGYLYIVTKNEFMAFKMGDFFNIKQIVKYPGGDEAFYIVSVN